MSDPTRDDEAALPAAPARRSRGRRAALWLGLPLAGVLLLAALALAFVWWALRSETGSAWLAGRVPRVTIVAPRGSLVGDFAAERIEIALAGGAAGSAATLRLDAPRWRGLAVERGSGGRWLRITIAELHADRLTLIAAKNPPEAASASAPPASLRLPLEVEIATLGVDALHLGEIGPAVARSLRSRVHLGAQGGALHRLDEISAASELARGEASLQVAADPPFALAARLSAHAVAAAAVVTPPGRSASAPAAPPGASAPPAPPARSASAPAAPLWQGEATIDGPLAALRVAATLRARPSASHPAQALDLRALVQPFAAWPLGALEASAEAIDLSAFAAGAPASSLSGRAVAATSGLSQPARVVLDLANARAGRWNEGLLPVRLLRGELRARPDDPRVLELDALSAELGSAGLPAGSIVGRGRWTPERWNFEATLQRLHPAALDARAAEMLLGGTIALVGDGFDAPPGGLQRLGIGARLSGELSDRRWPAGAPRGVKIELDGALLRQGDRLEIESRRFAATVGAARASLNGSAVRATRNAPWRTRGELALDDFDPAAWWPGSNAAWQRGPHRLNAQASFDLELPITPAGGVVGGSASAGGSTSGAAPAGGPANGARPWDDAASFLAATRGQASLALADSVLAGVALRGEATLRNPAGRVETSFDLLAGGNRLRGEGRFAGSAPFAGDAWRLSVDAPQLQRLAPWLRVARDSPAEPALSGNLLASARIDGRWPELTLAGELDASGVRFDAFSLRRAKGSWRLGSAPGASLEAGLSADDARHGEASIERVVAQLSGTSGAHRLTLRAESKALPPIWVDAVQGGAVAAATGAPPGASAVAGVSGVAGTSAGSGVAGGSGVSGTSAGSRVASASASGTSVAPGPAAAGARSVAVLEAEGGLVASGAVRATGWRGIVRRLEVARLGAPESPWLHARELRGAVAWSEGPLRAELEPGRAEVLGAALRWRRLAWRGAEAPAGGAAGAQTPPAAARLDLQAEIEPVLVAPLLARLQPDFGWGGDLRVGARIDVQGGASVVVDAAAARTGGDLTVSDELGVQSLGLSDLRFTVNARDGVWRFEPALAGQTVGTASGSVIARTSPGAAWPAADAPVEGRLELRVADLGTWGRWLPAGWRLGGTLRASAGIGGRFGAPEYTGQVTGSGLGVRNFLQGVEVRDGEVAIALTGSSARIERFSARAGEGTVSLAGDASLGDAPVAQLRLVADRFQLLGRVDRRIVASGSAALRLDKDTLALDGAFKVDQGLVDFTRSDAPALDSDVEVVRRVVADPRSPPPAPTPAPAATTRKVALDLRVGLGEKLRVRGRGLDAGLRGELHLTSPNGRLAVNGTVRAVDGSYAAYGQKLVIERGLLTFLGEVENPRLDIEATRPNLDVRVGVAVTGTALAPRIRLFSEPELSEIDKLSWLVLGRGNESAGRADTALLQSAALALLAGEGPGVSDRLTRAVGLDEVSIRQTDGELRETFVSIGKRIGDRWYVGYERGLNATAGNWQLIYRIARRLTVRAQTGVENSLDLIWTLRWK